MKCAVAICDLPRLEGKQFCQLHGPVDLKPTRKEPKPTWTIEYQCPKCRGKEVYFANQQVIRGIGGIYGNRAETVKKPFCRTCDIEADRVSVGGGFSGVSGAFWWIFAACAVVWLVFMLS